MLNNAACQPLGRREGEEEEGSWCWAEAGAPPQVHTSPLTPGKGGDPWAGGPRVHEDLLGMQPEGLGEL